jgi:thiamine biosynthesis lipoprotein ApbE
MIRNFLIIISILISIVNSVIAEIDDNYIKDSRLVMGTLLDITICNSPNIITDEVYDIAKMYDTLLSAYKNDSDLSRFNFANVGDQIKVKQETVEFLKFAIKAYHKSDKLVNIAIGGLTLPDKGILDTPKLLNIDINGFRIINNTTIKKVLPIYLDSGALGKGYAIDKIGEFLKKAQVPCALINFGHSSILGYGNKNWKLTFMQGKQPFTFSLKNSALSISQAINDEGRSHVVNPLNKHKIKKTKTVVALGKTGKWTEVRSTQALIKDDFELLIINSR